jgi:hypothetical protein
MENIKLIWDFFGPDSRKVSDHHLVHLQEFSKKENILFRSFGVEMESNNQFYSYIIINNSHLDLIKKRLKPNRAFKA